MNVLLLCTENSCRSIHAEVIFNHLALKGRQAMSAGSKPTCQVNSRAPALLERPEVAIEWFRGKSWDSMSATPDIVITVCSNTTGETYPTYLGPALRTHWDVDDLAKTTGSWKKSMWHSSRLIDLVRESRHLIATTR